MLIPSAGTLCDRLADARRCAFPSSAPKASLGAQPLRLHQKLWPEGLNYNKHEGWPCASECCLAHVDELSEAESTVKSCDICSDQPARAAELEAGSVLGGHVGICEHLRFGLARSTVSTV